MSQVNNPLDREAPRIEVVYGIVGSGKSSHACSIIDPARSFKLGIGPSRLVPIYTLVPRALIVRSHEKRNREIGLRAKTTTVGSVVDDIKTLTASTLVIDEWTGLYTSTLTWSRNRIVNLANNILSAIDCNASIERAVIVALEHPGPFIFRLHKKLGLWNRLLFERADKVTRINYGIPLVVKAK